MSPLGNILKKEIKELLTPGTVLPIVLITLIFGSIGNTMGGIEEEIQQVPAIGLINEDDGMYAPVVTSIFQNHSNIIINSTTLSEKDQVVETVQNHDGAAVLIIPENFSSNIVNGNPGKIEVYWIVKGTGIMDSIPSASVQGLLSYAQQQISRTLITQANASSNASLVLSPVIEIDTTNLKGQEYPNISPGTITQILSTQSTTTPIVMMMIIIIAGGMVISSMALEKENKTLETLLTLPVRRVSIVTGKIAASAIVGLFLALIYMFGIGYYMQSLTFDTGTGSTSFSLALSNFDLIIVGISLFAALVAGLSLCMLLGTMAKNYKSAQTLTAPVTMMAIFPMILTMFTDFDTLPLALKTLVFAIPFSHPMMAQRALLFGDYTLVIGGIIYVTIFSVVVIGLVIWVFTTDRLLTGTVVGKKLARFKRKR
jgi:ABC-2 type transport system permease protein